MTRRSWSAASGAAILAIVAACDLSTGHASVTSISNLRLPSPSVVIGDVMRDSLGAPTPLTIDVFDAHDQVIANPPILVSLLDTTISVDESRLVHGLIRDTVGARVALGVGGLQTPLSRILVTVAPTAAAMTTTAVPPTIAFTSVTDTSSQTNWSPLLGVTITGAGGVGAQGFVARYSIIRSPAPLVAGTPTVYLANDAGTGSSRDTTDRTGTVGRRVVLKQAAVGDAALLGGTKTDTIIVRVTASYAGSAIPGVPIDFIVPVAARKP